MRVCIHKRFHAKLSCKRVSLEADSNDNDGRSQIMDQSKSPWYMGREEGPRNV